MRRIKTLVIAFGLTAGSCSWIASTTARGTEALGRLLLSPEQERRLGAQLAAEVRRETPQHPDPFVQQFVTRVGQELLTEVPRKERANLDFTFSVIDAPDQVNAFALPGGHIFVFSGLLDAVDSEAEFAAVLSHEIAHVLAGHPSQQLAAQVGVQTLGSLALGQNAGAIQQLAANILATGYLAAHTREMEEEADTLGVAYLQRAGYDPAAMAEFFAKLARLEGRDRNVVENFVASHPAPASRSRRVAALIEAHDLAGGSRVQVGGLDEVQARIAAGSE